MTQRLFSDGTKKNGQQVDFKDKKVVKIHLSEHENWFKSEKM